MLSIRLTDVGPGNSPLVTLGALAPEFCLGVKSRWTADYLEYREGSEEVANPMEVGRLFGVVPRSSC
jgi:hypothetical protein